MHSRGTPKTMITLKDYDDVVTEVGSSLDGYRGRAEEAGVMRWNIVLDPGIGFAKDRELNLKILGDMQQIVHACQGCPVMVGPSREKFIGDVCGRPIPSDRIHGTAATCTAAIFGGAHILRLHDVALVDTVRMSDAILQARV